MFSKRVVLLVSIIAVVVMLLVANFFLTKRNSAVINETKESLELAAAVRVKMDEVIRNVHLLDLGLRGYALVQQPNMQLAYDTAFARKEPLFASLESNLRKQGFPMAEMKLLKDTIDGYFLFIAGVHKLIKAGEKETAIARIAEDRGYGVWHYHRTLSQKVDAFEAGLIARASGDYRSAIRNSSLLQLLLVIFTIPVLGFLAFYSTRSFRLSDALIKSQEERNKLLREQNELLEKLVHERTMEIATQNEEIIAQNEEILAHNEQLVAQQEEIEHQSRLLRSRNNQLEEASAIISRQKQIIEDRNAQLSAEIEQQNKELMASNFELVQKTNRIEQFAYTISHNLRAPIARLIGLVNLLGSAKSDDELRDLTDKTNISARELDRVVKDLSGIMQIQRLSTEVFNEIRFEDVLRKAKLVLEKEIMETGAQFEVNFEMETFFSLTPYVDNIFYNLISNSIKYRDPFRKPVIRISSKNDNGVVIEFSDNGLGLDLGMYGENFFGLYKRFHFHVDGRGIGLYLVKTQIEMLGGTISVSSVKNGGTFFTVRLPQTMDAPVAAPAS